MKFTSSLLDFQKALQRTLPAIPRKSTIPVLEHLHFSLTENSLRMIATDQDITIMSRMDVEGTEDGSILVPGKKINDIIRALGSEGTIEFAANPEKFDIKIKTTFGKYTIKGLDPDEYLTLPELFQSEKPEINEFNEYSGKAALIKKEDIMRLADRTSFAVSEDEFRPAMNGVLFQFRETFINAVSTDSFRLVRATSYADKPSYPADKDIILPQRAAELLKKVESDVIISFIENRKKTTHVRFDIDSTVIVSRLIDEKYPPYETVIPQNNDLLATISRSEFLSSIRRVAVVTSTLSNQLKIRLEKDQITVIGHDDEYGSEGIETLPCDYSGKNIDLAFNFKFLEQAIEHLNEEGSENQIIVSISEPNKPVLIRPNAEGDKLLMLIMPVKIPVSSI